MGRNYQQTLQKVEESEKKVPTESTDLRNWRRTQGRVGDDDDGDDDDGDDDDGDDDDNDDDYWSLLYNAGLCSGADTLKHELFPCCNSMLIAIEKAKIIKQQQQQQQPKQNKINKPPPLKNFHNTKYQQHHLHPSTHTYQL